MKSFEMYLKDIFEAIEAIESYAVHDFDSFLKDDKTQDAIMFNLVIMGEAANHIPEEIQEAHPEIPWSALIGTRNVIVHGYDQVKLSIVWDIIQKNLANLKQDPLKLL